MTITLFAPSKKQDREILWSMILLRYFSTAFAESLSGISSESVALFAFYLYLLFAFYLYFYILFIFILFCILFVSF